MKDLIVPYDQALALVELGFKEKCLGVYNKEKAFRFNNLHNPSDRSKSAKLTVNNGKVPAPLWQQAFDFILLNRIYYCRDKKKSCK